MARAGVDVGGTFTDVVLLLDRRVIVGKVPSTPGDASEGFAAGIRHVRDAAGGTDISAIAHGTTVATNAVLERRGARVALITSAGYRDILTIGRQQRPKLYDLFADRAEPLVERSFATGVPERIGADGAVVVPLDEAAARAAVDELIERGVDAIAVCLLFSFVDPSHERRIGEMIGDRARVSLSSDVLPEFREYERASTTALDAYVGPVVERYMASLKARFEVPITVMRSGGGTMSVDAAAREPVHTLLSGPAGGVRGAALVARTAGFDDIVTFDMGGTSTDVCLVEGGEPVISTEATIGGLPFRTPTLAVHTVGAGGGSMLWVDDARVLRAGPRSAGAVPGPACYGRGGTEPTVTDAHAALGDLGERLGPLRLDVAAARRALEAVGRQIGAGAQEVARAGLDVARAAMASAIRVVTVERGRDPRDFTLVGFGGAGPMHATALASELGMTRVLIPPAAGVLSALGLLAAPLTSDASRTSPMAHPSSELLDELAEVAAAGVRDQGAEPRRIERWIDCRYEGQAHEVGVPVEPMETLAERFAAEHRARFGWDAPDVAVEYVTFRARAFGPEPMVALPEVDHGTGARPSGARTGRPVYSRESLGSGDRLVGPCIVDGPESTTVIDEGWSCEVGPHGELVLWTR